MMDPFDSYAMHRHTYMHVGLLLLSLASSLKRESVDRTIIGYRFVDLPTVSPEWLNSA